MTLCKLLLWESEYMIEPIPLSAREKDEEGHKMNKHLKHASCPARILNCETHTQTNKLTCSRGSAAHLGQMGMLVHLCFLRLQHANGLTHSGHGAKGCLSLYCLSHATLHGWGHCALSSPLYQCHSVPDGLTHYLCITLMKETWFNLAECVNKNKKKNDN